MRERALETLESDAGLPEPDTKARGPVAGKREARLLNMRAGDDAIEAVAAGEQVEREAERLRKR